MYINVSTDYIANFTKWWWKLLHQLFLFLRVVRTFQNFDTIFLDIFKDIKLKFAKFAGAKISILIL